MSGALTHSWYITSRHLRALARQPWYIAITLVQPVVWLLLFGALFERVVEIPGFATGTYIEFLTPGVVVMSALFSNGFSGMSIIEDLERGVMDRFLVSPVRRGALMSGLIAQQALITIIQSVFMLVLALLIGARFSGGVVGVAVLVACAALIGAGLGSLSNALALLLRSRESVIGAVQFVVLPATFLSASLMEQDLAPAWIQSIARFNPVNWSVEAGREALEASTDWTFVLSLVGYLLIFAIVCAVLSVWAFRAYQRST